jgi:mannose-1-phosphate guanylyltransferase/mannose-6-phosphate isomerase
MTLDRYASDDLFNAPIVILSHENLDHLENYAKDYELTAVISEPSPRDTFAAVVSSAIYLDSIDKDSQILVLPSDHIVEEQDTTIFKQDIKNGLKYIDEFDAITFCTPPKHASTEFGYIECGNTIQNEDNMYHVQSFAEKPDVDTAHTYLKQGNYHWNTGVYLFNVQKLLAHARNLEPEIFDSVVESMKHSTTKGDIISLDTKSYDDIRAVSLDYALTEKLKKLLTVSSEFNWADVGTWDAFKRFGEKDKDESGNVIFGEGAAIQSNDCFIYSKGKKITLAGVENIYVIEGTDDIFIISEDQLPNMKDIISKK